MKKVTIVAISLLATSCSTNPALENGGGNTASGSAAGTATTHANTQLEHCPSTLGTLEITEDETAPWYTQLAQYQLPSTVPLLRLMVQQSGCFIIVDRSQGLANDMGEQSLAESGELRSNSHMQRGQIAAADYSMIPSINFGQQGGSGLGGALGFLPGGGLLAVAAGGLSENKASTTLLLVDNRSTVQVAAAQGSAHNFDFGGFGALFGGLGGGGLGGYSTTPEGKVVTAAFLDSYNQMVDSLRNYQAQTESGGLGSGGSLTVQGSGQ